MSLLIVDAMYPHHLQLYLSLLSALIFAMVYNSTKPRMPIMAMYSSPGPCYALPGIVGQRSHDPRSVHYKGPAYPFGIRHGKFRDDCSPGPCYLPDSKQFRDGKDGTPHYSLYSRPRDLKTFCTPGGPAYRPEEAGEMTKHRAPAYSFGSRQRHRRTDSCPGKLVAKNTIILVFFNHFGSFLLFSA